MSARAKNIQCKWGHLSAYFARQDKDGHNYCKLCMIIRNLHNNGRQNPATRMERQAAACKLTMAQTAKDKKSNDVRVLYKYKKTEATAKMIAHAEWLKIHGNRRKFTPTINPAD